MILTAEQIARTVVHDARMAGIVDDGVAVAAVQTQHGGAIITPLS